MKTKLLLIIAILGISGCNEASTTSTINADKYVTKQNPVKEFHVCVKQFGNSDKYAIYFTNDNWDTESVISDTFDLSSETMGNYVVYNPFLTRNKHEAISLAKKLSSYNKCMDYNKKVYARYEKMKEFRNSHPVKKVDREKERLVKMEAICVY